MCDCPWNPASIADLLEFARKYGEPAHLWMSRRDFEDLRKYALDVLDVNYVSATLKDGNVGTVYGKDVWIQGARPGWISVRDADWRVLTHALKGGNREGSTISHAHHQGHPHLCRDPECTVLFVMTG